MSENEIIERKKKDRRVLLISIVVIIGIIVGIQLITKSMWKSSGEHGKSKAKEELKNSYNLLLPQSNSNSEIKSFNGVAEEYNMTPEELQRAIDSGLSPEDFR